jgi:hypothetical protein
MRYAWKIPDAGERQQNVSPPYGGVNLPARSDAIFAAAPDCGRSIVALAMSDRRRGRWRHKAWIDVAKAAVAGDHMRRAFFDAAKFAIPHHVAGAEILHRAPRRIAEAAGVARRHAKAHRCRKSGRRQCRSKDDRHSAKFKPPRRRRKTRPPTAALLKRVPG